MEVLLNKYCKGTVTGALFRGKNLFPFKKLAMAVSICLLATPIVSCAATRPLPGSQHTVCLSDLRPESVSVARITDGDTLVLSDDRRVRLIGINTLEVNEKHPADRKLAQTATNALGDFVSAGSITIIPGIETHDRYGRVLAHVTRSDGRDAGHELVSQGLAFAVAVGQNTRCAEELLALEHSAQHAELGLWAAPGKWHLDKTRLTGAEKGFRVVYARVMQLTGRGKRTALILDNGLNVRLGKHWPNDNKPAQAMLNSIIGKEVKIKGWLGSSAGKSYMTLNHPSNLEVVPH